MNCLSIRHRSALDVRPVKAAVRLGCRLRNEWRRQRIYLAVDEGENYDYLV